MSKKVPLPKLIEALDIVQDELGFQVHRLEEIVQSRTETENEYHENLKKGYTDSRYWVRLLKRYHEGRLERRDDPVLSGADNQGPFIDEGEDAR